MAGLRWWRKEKGVKENGVNENGESKLEQDWYDEVGKMSKREASKMEARIKKARINAIAIVIAVNNPVIELRLKSDNINIPKPRIKTIVVIIKAEPTLANA